MDERTTSTIPAERPRRRAPAQSPVVPPGGLADPRALTVLTTEHWSLLSARGLVYNETFARAGMFLTFLSATLVALGLVSTATGFSREFLMIAAVVLAVDLFVGVATLGRVASATAEDLRCLQGMNRLRHAYHDAVPGLEHYFITGKHDDVRGLFAIYGATENVASRRDVLHGFTTVPGMVGVICATIASVLALVLVLLATGVAIVAGLVALVTLVAGIVASVATMTRQIRRFAGSVQSVFPSPRPDEAYRES